MQDSILLRMFFAMFTTQLPLLFVSIVGVIFVILRWKQWPGAAAWALGGLTLSILLCIGMPLIQAISQAWAMQDTSRHSVFTTLGILWSLLRAVSYGLLIVAVFAGRATTPHARGRGGALASV